VILKAQTWQGQHLILLCLKVKAGSWQSFFGRIILQRRIDAGKSVIKELRFGGDIN
jgi:hypothetical protein